MAELTYSQLLAENRQLRQELAESQRVVAQLQETVRQLQQRLEQSQRTAKRQAAPFAKGPPQEHPKTPGRKSGTEHGTHGHRPPPPSSAEVETHEAPLPERCPTCDGPVVETHLDEQFQTEIPRQPRFRRFRIHCGRCERCGKRCRGRHPLQTSDATGAAQSQLGPDAQAAIVYLNKHAGLAHGKIADVFDRLFGITVRRGACAQIVLRAGRRLEPVYQQIRERIKDAEHLTPDETGWRVGGRPAWLHSWVGGDGTTCFAIDPHRGADVLAGVIGLDWSGVMTHDGCPAYDRFTEAVHQQCVDHALRRARAMVEQQSGAARRFPEQVIELFQGALETRDQFLAGQMGVAALEQSHARYVDQLLDLTGRRRSHAANATFAKHLHGHGEQWLMFLIDPGIPATNHRAEQALKVPIVNRKVWGGNRTEAGARAQEATSSVLATCKNRAVDAFRFVSDTFRGIAGNLFEAQRTASAG